ncbi:MAG TPA: zinc-binding dehydrogenase [Ignavibacteria bacterium]|nr:zinc-binding dehydrogenase [Ignavibacteria bacterium]
MKAAVLHQVGKIEDLEKNLLVEEVDTPQINSDEVLIQINYAALNHRDVFITQGLYSGINLPCILGSDCSGVVVEKGSNVKNVSEGDEVVVNPSLNWGDNEKHQIEKNYKILGLPDNGTFAEYLKINKYFVHKKPGNLSMLEAGALPLGGATAYRATILKGDIKKNENLLAARKGKLGYSAVTSQSMIIKSNIKNNENVLVTGIGGGVATFALLFALSRTPNVFVTSGKDSKIQKAKHLGAIDGVNYKNENWSKELLQKMNYKIDVIIDGTGGEPLAKLMEMCSYGARIVSYGATLGDIPNFAVRRIFWKQLQLLGTTMASDKDFKKMLEYVEVNNIKPVIDDVFELNNIAKAFKRMESGQQFGKIVIKIN